MFIILMSRFDLSGEQDFSYIVLYSGNFSIENPILFFFSAVEIYSRVNCCCFYLSWYKRIFVYIFCVISICTLVFARATKSLVLNIERTSQN